eukprot:2110668-Prymnesium_polylepis.1
MSRTVIVLKCVALSHTMMSSSSPPNTLPRSSTGHSSRSSSRGAPPCALSASCTKIRVLLCDIAASTSRTQFFERK